MVSGAWEVGNTLEETPFTTERGRERESTSKLESRAGRWIGGSIPYLPIVWWGKGIGMRDDTIQYSPIQSNNTHSVVGVGYTCSL